MKKEILKMCNIKRNHKRGEERQVILEECKGHWQHWESQSPGGAGERCKKKD